MTFPKFGDFSFLPRTFPGLKMNHFTNSMSFLGFPRPVYFIPSSTWVHSTNNAAPPRYVSCVPTRSAARASTSKPRRRVNVQPTWGSVAPTRTGHGYGSCSLKANQIDYFLPVVRVHFRKTFCFLFPHNEPYLATGDDCVTVGYLQLSR